MDLLFFLFFSLLFLLIFVIALAFGRPITHAEPPIGSVPSHEKSLLVPALVTEVYPLLSPCSRAPFRQTPTQAHAGSGCGIIFNGNGYIFAVV